ncbi:MAG: diguanylate cyclase [Planctomycetes bacterium]|nr:diguanylate cyclase [Planctomycetota bacterium]
MSESDTRPRRLEDRVRGGPADVELSREITDLIYRDDLTGLFNRRHLREVLTTEVDWGSTNPTPFSILMIDVDYFKQINDTYGHLCGDHVLVHVSQLLRASFRRTDIIIRYAGDEFIVVLPATDKDTAFMLADRTRKRVAGFKYLHEDGSVEITVDMSIGVATFPIDARSAEDLIEKADRALYASKRAGRGMVSRATEGPADTLAGDEVLRLFPCNELVGREEVMEQIMAYLPSAEPRPPTLVVFEGGPGVGKTRILTEIVKLTHHEGITCLLERCTEANAVVPYQALVELITQFASTHIRELMSLLKEGSEEEMLCLAEVVPEISAALSEGAQPLSMSASQKRLILFNALRDLFATLSRSRPIAILLDEFHNIDQGSLMVLGSLEKQENVRIGMFGAMPFESLGDPLLKHFPIGDFLDLKGRPERIVELKIEPLTRPDVTHMISSLFEGREPDDAFDEAVFRASHGNPLYIEEMLKDMASRDLITMKGGRWQIAPFEQAAPPDSLDDAILNHLRKLDPETADVVASAAVIGSNFRVDVLQDITGRNEGYTLEILDKAMRASVVAPFSGDPDDEIKFVSDRVRVVSYDDTPEETRKTLHAQVAESEERKHKDNPDRVAAMLAYHFRRADRQEKAKKYETRVRTRAQSIFNMSEAVTYTEKKLATKIREGTQPLSGPSLKRLGQIFGHFHEALEARRLNSPGAAPVVNATRTIWQGLTPILAEVGTVTVAQKEQDLLVNTAPMDITQWGEKAADFWDNLLRHNGEGLTIVREVDEREIDVFLAALSEGSEVYVGLLWAAWLGENDVSHLYVDQRVRSGRIIKESKPAMGPPVRKEREEAVDEEEAEEKEKPEQQKVIQRETRRTAEAAAPTQEEGEPNVVRDIFYGGGEDLLPKEQTAQFSKTLKTALLKNDEAVLTALAGRLAERLVSPSLEVELQATDLVADAMRQAIAIGSATFVADIENAIFDALNEVRDPRVFGILVELGCEGALNAIKRADYTNAKKLIWAFQRFRKPGFSGSPGSRQAELGLEKLARSDAFGLLLADISSGDSNRQNAATALLIGFGTVAIPALVALIRDTDDFRTRKIAADILRESGAEAPRQLLAQLTPSSPAEHYVRILSVLDTVSGDVRTDVDAMLHHPDEQIRRGAVKVFARLPRQQARESLVELAYSDDPALVSSAISALGDMAWPAVAAELAHLLPSLKSDVHQHECCVALGKTRNPEAVPILAKVLRSRGFLGRFGGEKPEVRAAAAWALGQIGTEEAIRALQRSANDRDPTVRAAVHQALQRLH